MYCADQKGIIAAVTNFIHQSQGNITYIDQYVDRPNAAFFMRVECDLNGNVFNFKDFKNQFHQELGVRFSLHCDFYLKKQSPKMAVFVSKYDHCLYDILDMQQYGELTAEIPFILSNHPDLEIIAQRFDIPFTVFLLIKPINPRQRKNNWNYLKSIKLILLYWLDICRLFLLNS